MDVEMESRRDSGNSLEHRRAKNRMAQRRFRKRQHELKATAAIATDPSPQIIPKSPIHAQRSRSSSDVHPWQEQQHQEFPVSPLDPETTETLTSSSGSPSPSNSTPTGSSAGVESLKSSYRFGRDCLQGGNSGLLSMQYFVNMENLDLHAADRDSKCLSSPSVSRSDEVSIEHILGGSAGRGPRDSSLEINSFPETASCNNSSGHGSMSENFEAGAISKIILPSDDQAPVFPVYAGKGKSGELSSGWLSPLHIAAQKGHDRIVRVLMQHNSDCNKWDSDGLTPLIHATIGGYEDVVLSLLSHGALIDKVDSHHKSALHWAVTHKRVALLKILLNHCIGDQILVDIYDNDGRTALHNAIDMGFEAGVQLLLQFGANVHCMARNRSRAL